MRAGIMLQRVPWRDYELCTLAIQNQGLALQDVPRSLIDFELCKLAVRQNGFALELVPEYFQCLQLCYFAVLNKKQRVWYMIPEQFQDEVKEWLEERCNRRCNPQNPIRV